MQLAQANGEVTRCLEILLLFPSLGQEKPLPMAWVLVSWWEDFGVAYIN